MCLFEAVMCHAKFEASAAWLEEHKLREIVRSIPSLPIGRWRWGNTTFFAGRGAFLNAAENCPPGRTKRHSAETKTYHSVCIGAKTPEPLQFLKPLVDERWEHVGL
jgi:hypothetical protein